MAGDSDCTADETASTGDDPSTARATEVSKRGDGDTDAVDAQHGVEAGEDATGSRVRGDRPEVVVPMDLYKTVTVFSTLFAIALVVGGMIALDAATGRATADAENVDLPIAFLGVAAIVLGAATYAFAARFRAEGMGNPKDADDER